MKSQAYPYVNKIQLSKTLTLSFIQQFAVALSTFCLAKAGYNYKDPSKLIAWCMGSFLFHILAPAIQIIIKRWEYNLFFETYKSFIQKNLLEKYGSPCFWRQKDLKDSFTASIGVDAEGYLGAILFVGLDVFSYFISLVLGVIVLGSTIDTKFIPAFLLSCILSYFLYVKMNKPIKTRFEAEQVARTAFNSHVMGAWDNVFLKKESIKLRYEKSLFDKYEQAKEHTKNAASSAECLVFALGFVAAIPVLLLVLFIGFQNTSTQQTSALLALLATVPRQLNMLTTFRGIFQNMAALIGYETKMKVIHQNVNIENLIYHDQIKLDKIKIQQCHYSDLLELENKIKAFRPGRYEIRGENGSGKSTLLLHLNFSLENSFYLPSLPSLAISDIDMIESSGENLLRHIDYLRLGSDQILLLDEWDANLDELNIHRTEVLLNELAKDKIIIEVRHRKAE